MTEGMALKTQLLNNFSKFLAGNALIHADNVLYDVFKLSAHCRTLYKDPKSLFTSEELQRFRDDLSQAMPYKFNVSLIEHLGLLDIESATMFRCTRSGLQFLKDDYIDGQPDLEEKFSRLMDGGGLTRIELKLDDWEGERDGTFSDVDPEDLRGVPESHHWWSAAERTDSKVAYGKPAEEITANS